MILRDEEILEQIQNFATTTAAVAAVHAAADALDATLDKNKAKVYRDSVGSAV